MDAGKIKFTITDTEKSRGAASYKYLMPDGDIHVTVDISSYNIDNTSGGKLGIALSTELPGDDCSIFGGSERTIWFRYVSGDYSVFAGSVGAYSNEAFAQQPTKLRIKWIKSTGLWSFYAYVNGVWETIQESISSKHREYLILFMWVDYSGRGGNGSMDNLVFKYGCPDVSPTAWTTTTTSSTTCSTCSTLSTEPPP